MAREWHATVLELHAQGLRPAAIAREVPVSMITVSRFLCEQGLRPRKGSPQRRIPLPWHAPALALADEGYGPSEAARRLGVTKNMVSGFFDRQGIKGPFGGEPSTNFEDRMRALEDKMKALVDDSRNPKNFIQVQAKKRHHQQLESWQRSLAEVSRW